MQSQIWNVIPEPKPILEPDILEDEPKPKPSLKELKPNQGDARVDNYHAAINSYPEIQWDILPTKQYAIDFSNVLLGLAIESQQQDKLTMHHFESIGQFLARGSTNLNAGYATTTHKSKLSFLYLERRVENVSDATAKLYVGLTNSAEDRIKAHRYEMMKGRHTSDNAFKKSLVATINNAPIWNLSTISPHFQCFIIVAADGVRFGIHCRYSFW